MPRKTPGFHKVVKINDPNSIAYFQKLEFAKQQIKFAESEIRRITDTIHWVKKACSGNTYVVGGAVLGRAEFLTTLQRDLELSKLELRRAELEKAITANNLGQHLRGEVVTNVAILAGPSITNDVLQWCQHVFPPDFPVSEISTRRSFTNTS